jgi:hypothetical protein
MVTKIFLILILGIVSIKSFSQKFTFSLLRQNIAYIGFDNPISCTVEGYPCKSVILSTENGTIEKIEPCIYNFRPSKVQDTKFSIYIIIEKNKKKKIGELFIRARNIPDPIAYVGGKDSGKISLGSFKAQGGISAGSGRGFGIDVKYTVKSFKVTAYRNKELLFFYAGDSNLFTEEIRNLFNTLQAADVILFFSIKVKMPDNNEVFVKPFELIIE